MTAAAASWTAFADRPRPLSTITRWGVGRHPISTFEPSTVTARWSVNVDGRSGLVSNPAAIVLSVRTSPAALRYIATARRAPGGDVSSTYIVMPHPGTTIWGATAGSAPVGAAGATTRTRRPPPGWSWATPTNTARRRHSADTVPRRRRARLRPTR